MKDFWAGPWLHCPPEPQFANGRRVIFKKLCFGPVEAQIWFVTEDGGTWYEQQLLEDTLEGERFLEPISRTELRRVLDREISLCRKLGQEALIPLFQAELERWS